MNRDIGEQMAARGLRCSGQDSGLQVSILLHGAGGWVLSGFCFMAFFRICCPLFFFVGLWLCLFISSAVDCPHVYTLFFSANRDPV